MEAFLVLLALGLLLGPFIMSIIALVRASGVSALRAELGLARSAIAKLQTELDEIRRQLHPTSQPVTAAQPEPDPILTLATPEPTPALPSLRAAAAITPLHLEPEPTPLPEPLPAEPTPAPILAASETACDPGNPTVPETVEPTPAPALEQPTAIPASRQPAAAALPPPKKNLNFEELLGGQIALKLGVVFVTIGMVFFLALAIKEMGPIGKVLTGLGVGAGMLGAGLFAESRERYRSFGRAIVAGAWGIIYFVAFATHFVPAARIIESPPVAVLVLLAAASAAVGFSLRYKNEWTTTFAFLLIFLSLGIAAANTDATFNLVATAIVAVGLAFLGLRLGWDRLLGLGTAATWVTLALWLLPNTWELAALPEGERSQLLPLILPLLATWTAFTAAGLWRGRSEDARENWLGLSIILNALGGAGLVLHLMHTLTPTHAFWVAASFGSLYLGVAWQFRAQQRRPLYLLTATVGLALLAAVSPLKLGLASYWIPVSRLVGIELLLLAGVWLKERYFRGLGYLVYVATVLEVLFIRNEPVLLTAFGISFHHRIVLWAGVVLTGYLNAAVARRHFAARLSPVEIPSVFYLFSGAASLTLTVLVWQELPGPWIAPFLATLGFLMAVLARRFRALDLLIGSLFMLSAAWLAAFIYNIDQPDEGLLPLRYLAFAVSALLSWGAYALLRRTAPLALGDEIQTAVTPAAIGISVLASFLTLALVFVEAPAVFVAPIFALMFLLFIGMALRYRRTELLAWGFFWQFITVTGLLSHSAQLEGEFLGMPARTFSVALTLLFWFAGSELLARHDVHRPTDCPKGLYFGDWSILHNLSVASLFAPTLVLVLLVKVEALAYDKNLLVALLWGFIGLTYLEVARAKRARLWFQLGQLIYVAAVGHLFMVNFVQPGSLGVMSLRLVTVLPFAAMTHWLYASFADTTKALPLTPRELSLRPVYLYVQVATFAALMMYELPRMWVIVGWAALAVAMVLRFCVTQNFHWRLNALILAVATMARALGVNLYYRDQTATMIWNYITLPLTLLLLLAGYLTLRFTELKHASVADTGGKSVRLAAKKPRIVFFIGLVGIATAALWVEAEGTLLTVFLSILSLLVVTLGFVAKERLARLVGLLMLALCTLKLFVYDMRGLSGMPRILSFIVLGLVLIAVGYAYTRFKERLQEIL